MVVCYEAQWHHEGQFLKKENRFIIRTCWWHWSHHLSVISLPYLWVLLFLGSGRRRQGRSGGRGEADNGLQLCSTSWFNSLLGGERRRRRRRRRGEKEEKNMVLDFVHMLIASFCLFLVLNSSVGSTSYSTRDIISALRSSGPSHTDSITFRRTHRSQTWPASLETFWVCWFYCGWWPVTAGDPGETHRKQLLLLLFKVKVSSASIHPYWHESKGNKQLSLQVCNTWHQRRSQLPHNHQSEEQKPETVRHVQSVSTCSELSYPSEGDNVERVLSTVDGVQEVAVGDLRTRKHLQLTAHTHTHTQKFKVVIQVYYKLTHSHVVKFT